MQEQPEDLVVVVVDAQDQAVVVPALLGKEVTEEGAAPQWVTTPEQVVAVVRDRLALLDKRALAVKGVTVSNLLLLVLLFTTVVAAVAALILGSAVQ
jgi:hypothetical protein